MFKPKVVLPEQAHLQSPYQLEDCRRRLSYLKDDLQPIAFTRVDNDRIQFRIRQVTAQHVPFPMIAFEITGTLRRWGGTGTIIDGYHLKRFRARIDTWVVLFIGLSALAAIGLILPALLTTSGSIQLSLGVVLLVLLVVLLPILTWVGHTRALDIDRDIDALHQSILRALDIEDG